MEGPIFLTMKNVTGLGGTGEDVAAGFQAEFDALEVDVFQAILIGITDTPTANQRAWRLLEAQHPKQFWIGCGTHEVSLLFKEWVKKVPELMQLFREELRCVKWINNHSELLKMFRDLVPKHFQDPKRHTGNIGLYMPADTRMMTVFKMLHRLLIVWDVLFDLAGRPEYETASQKALKQWSDRQKPEKKLVTIDGRYPDSVKVLLTNLGFRNRIHAFVQSSKSAVYLLRLTDGATPVLGKFYYACALVDKHLRTIKEAGNVSYAPQMLAIFTKRWKRWHRPLHTFAYAVDPCYQAHDLTREEKRDCEAVIRKLSPSDWPRLKVEFDRWRSAGESIFDAQVWAAADKYHGYQWWDSFGDDFEFLQRAAVQVLSKCVSASACEFNWSDVGHVISKRTCALKDETIEKKVNARAMHKLDLAVDSKVLLGNIPKLDDVLDEFVNEEIARVGGLDDCDSDSEEEESQSSDDEEYELVAEEEDPLYELGGGNQDLEMSIDDLL